MQMTLLEFPSRPSGERKTAAGEAAVAYAKRTGQAATPEGASTMHPAKPVGSVIERLRSVSA